MWDILQHPTLGDVRPRPYVERRALMLDVLADVPPPIQAVPATDDYATAMVWFEHLQKQGVEGVVVKPGRSAYQGYSKRRTPRSDSCRSSPTYPCTAGPPPPRCCLS
ncbi:hypothetical protein ACIRD2_33735 [Streptomyces sp. NPDC093595]|uniref:hypothetical protein n=1 Tax=Streptomyces sp. NPDC093595 TaxID=3366045 RepID=UPI0037FB0D21